VRPSDFEPHEVALILGEAGAVWEELGMDFIMALRQEKVHKSNIARAHVIELVLDADRLTSRLPKELADRFLQLDYPQMKKMVRPAFPYEWYGL
jgi:hypothetical protein